MLSENNYSTLALKQSGPLKQQSSGLTQKELEISRNGDRKWVHADLTRAHDAYELRPKGPDGSMLGTVAVAPKLNNNGHTKASLMRIDPAQLDLSSALHEGGRVKIAIGTSMT